MSYRIKLAFLYMKDASFSFSSRPRIFAGGMLVTFPHIPLFSHAVPPFCHKKSVPSTEDTLQFRYLRLSSHNFRIWENRDTKCLFVPHMRRKK